MATYRERRARRAEQYREWAGKREERATAQLDSNPEMRHDWAFITQPGHIPARERMNRADDRAHESLAKARDMRSRADGIEGQLATSIYDDDPDAIERLREKIAGLEAERKRITDYNASCRKALKADPGSKHGDLSLLDERQRARLADLMRVCSYQVRPGGAFPGYATQNIGGRIGEAKRRLAALEAKAQPMSGAARVASVVDYLAAPEADDHPPCPMCGEPADVEHRFNAHGTGHRDG